MRVLAIRGCFGMVDVAAIAFQQLFGCSERSSSGFLWRFREESLSY